MNLKNHTNQHNQKEVLKNNCFFIEINITKKISF